MELDDIKSIMSQSNIRVEYAFLVDTMAILLSYLGSHILLSMEVGGRAIVDISVLFPMGTVGAHESQSLIIPNF